MVLINTAVMIIIRDKYLRVMHEKTWLQNTMNFTSCRISQRIALIYNKYIYNINKYRIPVNIILYITIPHREIQETIE